MQWHHTRASHRAIWVRPHVVLRTRRKNTCKCGRAVASTNAHSSLCSIRCKGVFGTMHSKLGQCTGIDPGRIVCTTWNCIAYGLRRRLPYPPDPASHLVNFVVLGRRTFTSRCGYINIVSKQQTGLNATLDAGVCLRRAQAQLLSQPRVCPALVAPK